MEDRLGAASELGAQLVDGEDVVGIGHRDMQFAALAIEADREQLVPAREVLRHQRHRRAIRDQAVELDAAGTELLRQRLAEVSSVTKPSDTSVSPSCLRLRCCSINAILS
jgi:hypothetical protein